MALAGFTNAEMLQTSYYCSAVMWVYFLQCNGMCISAYLLYNLKLLHSNIFKIYSYSPHSSQMFGLLEYQKD